MSEVTAGEVSNEAATEPEPAPPPPIVGEDWLAVWIGVAVIVVALLGLRPAAPVFDWSGAGELANVLGAANLWRAAVIGLLVLVPTTIGAALLGAAPAQFVAGAVALYGLGLVAQVAAGQATAEALGLEYVLFALLIGIALNQLGGVTRRLAEAARSEFYIKTGLVVLGASMLFDQIVRAGALGLVQAVVVVLAVWFFCFRLARRLRVDDELGTMISSAVAICGVSAAIAACGAIQGDRKKLSYVTSLVLVVAVPMMVVMPWIAAATEMPQAVAGAWLGGTLDTSAAVVAAGELISDVARDTAVVVKMSQNALIGVAAFFITLWWALRSQGGEAGESAGDGLSMGRRLAVVWERFPKFILGFIAVSLVFSFVLSTALVSDVRGTLSSLRTAWFAMAFVSIGLETSLGGLVKTGDGRPAVAFVGGQAFNIVLTLVVAYLLFGSLS